jgi:hypothetical protein
MLLTILVQLYFTELLKIFLIILILIFKTFPLLFFYFLLFLLLFFFASLQLSFFDFLILQLISDFLIALPFVFVQILTLPFLFLLLIEQLMHSFFLILLSIQLFNMHYPSQHFQNHLVFVILHILHI